MDDGQIMHHFHLSESVLVALATGLPATIASVATLINSIRNGNHLRKTTEKIEEIHIATNGMKEQLIASTAKASHAEGMSDQRAQDKRDKQ